MENVAQHEIAPQLSERERTILRLMADGFSNQEIADRLYLALTTVKWYIHQINDKLDTHTRTQTVARAHQLKLVGAGDTSRIAHAEQLEPPENPYKGLQAFQETDAADFFGRDKLIRRLIERLGEDGASAHFLAVVGPSGSGKSSVVKAGLIPALRHGDLRGSERWLIAGMLPGSHPLEELEIALLRIAANPPPSLLPQLREDERGLLRAVRRVLPDETSVLVLVIDQFEEVFTLVESPAERQYFLDSICAAATDPRSPLRVIVTLRADFFDHPLLYCDFGELMRLRTDVVLPLTADELQQAITEPSKRVGVSVDVGLTAAMVADANQQPGALPLLQYALTELFDTCEGNSLTLEAYRAIGGVLGALSRRADALYEGLDKRRQEASRQMFLRLVTLGEGVEDTRRRASQAELFSLGGDPDLMDEIVQMFAAYRLLTLDQDPVTRAATVELAHEALLREWKRLREWLDESRADVRMGRLLANEAQEWRNAGQESSFLLTGSRLAQFEEWAAVSGLALTPDEQAYLTASITEREQRESLERERQKRETHLERRSRNILRALVVILFAALLGAVGLTGVAVNQSRIAQRNEAEARSLAMASAAQLALNEGNNEQAIDLANTAIQSSDNPPALAQRVIDLAAFAPQNEGIFQESGSIGSGILEGGNERPSFVIVSHFGVGNPFGDVAVRGMEDACEFLNVSCQWLGDWEMMGENWLTALALNPDGIGTTIGPPEVMREPILQAAERGIPVVAFNVARGSEADTDLPALLYIGSNDYTSGRSNARRVFSEAQSDGVTILRGVCTNQAVGQPSLDARCAGVESVFNEEGVPLDQLQISFCEGPCEDFTQDEAARIEDYFSAHPETNAIFMLGPHPAESLNDYFHQHGIQPGEIYATSHDTSPEIFQMIQDGYLLQTIDQQVYLQGFQTIISLYLYHQYGMRPSGFINTSSVVDQSNVDNVIQLVEAGYR